MWRDELEKVTQYYFLANYYQETDKEKYEKYTEAYHHHLKKYEESFIQNSTYEQTVPVQARRARIRFLHAAVVAARQPVDVHIDGRFAATITYLTVNPHIPLKAGKHKVTLYPTRQTTNPIWQQEITVDSGKRYLFAVANKSQKPTDGVQLLRYEETDTIPVNKAKIRFIHLSPDAPPLDLVERQQNISFSDIPYKEHTPYAAASPGRTNIQVRVTGTPNNIAAIAFDTTQNHAYTLIAAGNANNLYWLLLLDR
ncbi:DUF4397 domain-containing protein [Shimazuella sp. AN120528]|uniref:DUF4397 domain-containing protein n=1 Tax=Shimazuella soli TaxID=1892854 RepID=UPI001F107C7F|nr:DUF4397 domain-containing protein [Shimazuella soli]MCH5586142.1 DUF4397 domain-containing protein [Shimazuella soli]